MPSLADEFEQLVISENEKAKSFGYNATRFKQMLNQYGAVGTAKQLLSKEEISEGLMRLWELNCLDESIEAQVIQERFQSLFTEIEIVEARRRLEALNYFKEY